MIVIFFIFPPCRSLKSRADYVLFVVWWNGLVLCTIVFVLLNLSLYPLKMLRVTDRKGDYVQCSYSATFTTHSLYFFENMIHYVIVSWLSCATLLMLFCITVCTFSVTYIICITTYSIMYLHIATHCKLYPSLAFSSSSSFKHSVSFST